MLNSLGPTRPNCRTTVSSIEGINPLILNSSTAHIWLFVQHHKMNATTYKSCHAMSVVIKERHSRSSGCTSWKFFFDLIVQRPSKWSTCALTSAVITCGKEHHNEINKTNKNNNNNNTATYTWKHHATMHSFACMCDKLYCVDLRSLHRGGLLVRIKQFLSLFSALSHIRKE